MSKVTYNPYPLGKIPKELQRPELDQLKTKGYEFDDPREVVDICEKKIAKFFGANYCVMTDCCSHAIFLSLKYLRAAGQMDYYKDVIIPKHTYVSVPMQILHAGLHVRFKDIEWKGYYKLEPTRVIDAAVIWEEGSYVPYSLMCLSFQIKKTIPEGKAGAILTDNKDAYNWLKLASYDGRNLNTPYDSKGHVTMIGWHMYATPETCARILLLMETQVKTGRYMGSENYPDVSEMMKGLSL